MTHFKVKKGYTVPIKGEAERSIEAVDAAPCVGVCPATFSGVKPKLLVKEDDMVEIGTPLFFDKKQPDVKFGSPGSGRVTAIRYGARRVILEIVITPEGDPSYKQSTAHDLPAIGKLSRADLIQQLLEGCMWPYLIQRPFSRIANPEAKPKAIFVNAMDTAPLAADPNFSLTGAGDAFKAGMTAMKVLADGAPVHVAVDATNANPDFTQGHEGTVHTFSGKHPAGLVGTHISRIDPINRGECVWHIHARDLVMVGRFLLDGKYPTERVVAVAGPGAVRRKYFKTQLGVPLNHLLKDNLADGEQRVISGNVLTGIKVKTDGFLLFYHDLVTVVPEGRVRHFLGWITPGFKNPTLSRTMATGFIPGKTYNMHTNYNGGHRAIIQSGLYNRLVALDVHPEYLIKAAIAGDIDDMEQLGILECDPEDFALCAYACPSKTEVCSIIRDGLDLVEKEG